MRKGIALSTSWRLEHRVDILLCVRVSEITKLPRESVAVSNKRQLKLEPTIMHPGRMRMGRRRRRHWGGLRPSYARGCIMDKTQFNNTITVELK